MAMMIERSICEGDIPVIFLARSYYSVLFPRSSDGHVVDYPSGILNQRLLCHAYKTHRLNTPNLIARAIRIPESN